MAWSSSLKIVMVGDASVGKSALFERIRSEDHPFNTYYQATIGADFLTKDITIDDNLIQLQLWDTAGQERFASIGYQFYRGADAFIAVYDVTDEESFDLIDSRIQKAFMRADCNKDAPVLLLANKYDLVEDCNDEHLGFVTKISSGHHNPGLRLKLLVNGHCRQIHDNIPMDILQVCIVYLKSFTDIKGREYAQRSNYNMVFYEVSAKTGFNVHRAVMDICSKAYKLSLENKPELPDIPGPCLPSPEPEEWESNSRWGCC